MNLRRREPDGLDNDGDKPSGLNTHRSMVDGSEERSDSARMSGDGDVNVGVGRKDLWARGESQTAV